MANPMIHSISSAKRFLGQPSDYIKIHQNLDQVKSSFNDHRGRFITHNTYYCYEILPLIFGYNIINSDGKSVDVVDIGLQHLQEDFRHKFIPTLYDWSKCLTLEPWMKNGIKVIDNQESQELSQLFKYYQDKIKELETKIKELEDGK